MIQNGCPHNKNVRVEVTSKLTSEYLVENGIMVALDEGDPVPYGYYVFCEDCGESDYYPEKKVPKWVIDLTRRNRIGYPEM